MLVSSRIFGGKIEGVETDCFVPLIDMLYHKYPKESTWKYDEDQKSFILKSNSKKAKSNEITYSCGIKCNSRFLLNYGFIVKNNKESQYPFKIFLSSDSELFEIKKKILQKYFFSDFLLKANIEDPAFEEYLGLLRFCEISDEQTLNWVLDLAGGEKNFSPNVIPIFSLEIEKKIMTRIREFVMIKLMEYPTTISEDEQILRTNISQNSVNCVLMTMDEKIVLSYFLSMTEEVIPLISNPEELCRKSFDDSIFINYILNFMIAFKDLI